MAFIDDFAESLLELEDEIPQSFTWEDVEYPCFASGASKGGALEPYGWSVDQDLIIIVRGELFGGTNPEKNDSITFEGTSFRIERVLTAPDNGFLRLTCMNPDRGA